MNSIEVRNVEVSYNQNKVLVNTNISITKGSLVALVGMNGAGKSTLFKTIMGFITPQQGEIRIEGQDVRTAQKKGIIAYMPQSEDVDWEFPLSVWDVVMMGRYGYMNILRTPSRVDINYVEEALKRVEMFAYRDRQIGELSGGQKKRVFLARALAQEAKVLLLDEPFSGVDARSEAQITEVLLELQKKDCTMLISTHELTSLSEYCDHVAFIKHTILAYGPTEKVFNPENISQTFDGMIHRLAFGGKQIDIHH